LLEAVRAAREALGPDALVVAARRLRRRRWLRRSEEAGFEVTALAQPLAGPAASFDRDPLVAEIRQLGAQMAGLAAALERGDRLADEMADLRRAVEALGERPPAGAEGDLPGRRRGLAVRLARDDRRPEPTPRSVESWNRS
jgi:hypothetical protein